MSVRLKAYAKAKGVHLYEIAEFKGMAASNFSMRYMRRKLNRDELKELRGVVDEIAARRAK